MFILILLVLFSLFLIVRFPALRIAVFSPVKVFIHFIRDSVDYFYYKKYNLCPTGEMVCFSGLFGKGKTLSAVHTVRKLYKKYNDKKVYDPARRAFVRQKIHILSNVTFTDIPFSPLSSLAEVVSEMQLSSQIDEKEHTLTVILILIDEASVQLNSRAFKANVNPEFLNSLLTCRHYHSSFFYTSQRFNLTDKLLRDVTQRVIDCDKVWRFQIQRLYDAWTLENTSRPDEVRPLSVSGFFVLDDDYNAYNTMAVVSSLSKAWKQNDLLTEEEILLRRNYHNNNNENEEKKRK